ncbi:D-tagatose-bisphosphate aldolase, class II, non-catalytic subunit [Rhizobium sp. LC145]|uniref:D-tagatose-bisphosphate aldolase, class II, non-catalytic subunit n=1 Tax=Rhizobium sp. LC145 TaxID=1120688 RepID=UPI00062A4326|nr:D-tagatose-bisphosphate aldolase, class II, non-catalytic subunit [Rhizobium sp. LC145]KKX27110.1 tagatose-bisphosphate aldolase [Rhizobium sp. LC145]TKT56573.1 D-tagatose-bisphosphate aldolase, class II, non-catalytic subunit [Rhizobiaceae bacterium LC148]
MQQNHLLDIATWRNRSAGFRGIPSICSAHPFVIEAAMLHAAKAGSPLLIEATCNQVNQDGGYTGMTPAHFHRFVSEIAAKTGFAMDRVILGGDHLGPNPWKSLSAAEAMDRADVMIRAYAKAGFTKLHLDTSMGCAGEPVALPDEITAERAARLAAAAEDEIGNTTTTRPVYIVGTEVPIPGGAMEELEVLEVTRPEAAIETVKVHAEAFERAGVGSAFDRVVGAVVQPGVEFGNHNVIAYNPEQAKSLSACLKKLPNLVFEAHSTDYQTRAALKALVTDGFAILKVGPGLTFALREALYGLDQIAAFLMPESRRSTLMAVAEAVMVENPGNWNKYYHGSPAEQHLQRHYSYSDRIRYYWPEARISEAVSALLSVLGEIPIPETMISQHLGALYPGVRAGKIAPTAKGLILGAIDLVLEDYFEACRA